MNLAQSEGERLETRSKVANFTKLNQKLRAKMTKMELQLAHAGGGSMSDRGSVKDF
jgi:hypothetical protein